MNSLGDLWSAYGTVPAVTTSKPLNIAGNPVVLIIIVAVTFLWAATTGTYGWPLLILLAAIMAAESKGQIVSTALDNFTNFMRGKS